MIKPPKIAAVALAGGLAIGLAGLVVKAGAASAARRRSQADGSDQTMAATVTIAADAASLFAHCRDLTNLAGFMPWLRAVTPLGEDRYRCEFAAPAGRGMAVDVSVVASEPDALIAFAAAPDAPAPLAGTFRFAAAPGARGTRVSLAMHHHGASGRVAAMLASLLPLGPGIQARHDLKRLKMLFEAGEIATGARTRPRGAPASQSEAI